MLRLILGRWVIGCGLRAEGVRKATGVLHQLMWLTDIWKAEPEHSPATSDKTAITVLEVPEDVEETIKNDLH